VKVEVKCRPDRKYGIDTHIHEMVLRFDDEADQKRMAELYTLMSQPGELSQKAGAAFGLGVAKTLEFPNDEEE